MKLNYAPFVVTLASLLGGCVGFSPSDNLIGQSRQDVLTRMGTPSKERQLPSGSRLEYARGPMGRQTYFVQLDPKGTVTSWEQVLTEANFEKLREGMSADEVEMVVGPHTQSFSTGRANTTVWKFVYASTQCFSYLVEMDSSNRVKSLGHGPDPACENTAR